MEIAVGMHAGSSRSMESDMKKMPSDASFSDIVFLCGDAQEELPAARLLVAARSPLLEAILLKIPMAEQKQSRILLPEIDAATMRICLEFFYTDTVHAQSWLGPMSIMKVISAAKFFLVVKLEHLSISHLESILDGSCDDKFQLIKAYSYGVHLQDAHPCNRLHALLQKLITCIRFTEDTLDLDHHRHISEQALLHLVRTLCGWERDAYGTFHIVIQWCAS